MPANDIYELAIHGHYMDQALITTHHFRQVPDDSGIGTEGGPPGDLAAWWLDHGQGDWLDMMPTGDGGQPAYTLDQISIRKEHVYSELRHSPYEVPKGISGARSLIGDREPPWMVAHATVHTAAASRRARGRFFVSGLAKADVDAPDNLHAGDTYFKAFLLGYVSSTGLGAFLPGGAVSNWRLGVFSRRLAGYPAPRRKDGSPAPIIAPPAAPINAFHDATAVGVNGRVSTLRSRRAR